MSNQIAKVFVPAPVAMPRGAQWASGLFAGLMRFGHRFWQALEAVGQARAERELNRLAVRFVQQPELAQPLQVSLGRIRQR